MDNLGGCRRVGISFKHAFDLRGARRPRGCPRGTGRRRRRRVAPAARYTVLERLETAARRQTAVAHTVVAGLEQLPGWPAPHIALSDVLRISRAEAGNRVRDAALLAPGVPLTGEPCPAAARHRQSLARRNPRRRTPGGYPTVPARSARRHRPGGDRHRRAHPGRPGRHPAPRSAPDRGRTDGPDLEPRREVLRSGPGAAARVHLVRCPAPRWHEHRKVDRHPAVAGRTGRLVRQVRRTRDGQPRRPHPGGQRRAQRGRRPPGPALPRPTPARRPGRAGALPVGQPRTGHPPGPAGHRDRHHHRGRPAQIRPGTP